jgi:hypothetical protein
MNKNIRTWRESPKAQKLSFNETQDGKNAKSKMRLAASKKQPKLTVRLTSFPESNGKRNWTALLVRVDEWDGLIGNCGGISLARGELWNRVAWEAEQARFLIGERDTEPFILDYGNDIKTPEEWVGERSPARLNRHKVSRSILTDESLSVNL